MVDIVTAGGVFLDLDPAAEFEITVENPMLQDERIPVPFSTAIAFLPTPTNRAAFGYLDAMMLEPTVREIAAKILIGGVPLYSGSLIYDSIEEDGRINYTFSGRDPESEWSGKLWELTISGTVYYPLIVDASKVASNGIGAKPSGTRPGNLYNIDGKYRNYPGDTSHRKLSVPAVPVPLILGNRISFDQVSGAVSRLADIVVFGTHEQGLPDVAATLPDMTFADFVRALCKLFNAAVFQDGGAGYSIHAAADILSQGAALDWDGKVSDRFRSRREPAEGYALRYSDGDDGDSANAESPGTAATLAAVVAGAAEEYDVAQHTPTGDLYSRKLNTVTMFGVTGHSSSGDIYGPVGTIDEVLIDRQGSSGTARAGSAEDNERIVDIGFKLPRCAPSGWTKHYDDGSADQVIRRMAPIISLPATGGDRPADVYVAIYGNGQAGDKGVVIANPDSASSADLEIGDSLAPVELFQEYHQAYAAWLAGDRQILSVDLDLSTYELVSFRMWQAVRVRSRNFLVSKLSVRIAASGDGVDVSADLISL